MSNDQPPFTSNPGGLRLPKVQIPGRRQQPEPGTDRRDGNVRADEFSNGVKEGQGGAPLDDHRPSKGGAAGPQPGEYAERRNRYSRYVA